jgi:predicted phosphodiesterase
MRIRVLSDLHIEFFDLEPPEVDADVIVLAGDILTEHYGLAWARRVFPNTPVHLRARQS